MSETAREIDQPRRSLLNWLLSGGLLLWLGAVFYPVGRYLIPPRLASAEVGTVEAATLDELAPGSYKIFRFGRMPAILIRLSSGEFKALAARCTHLDCTVQFKSDTEQVWCACHNGIYDLEGRNVSGPPPKPLESFEVVVKDEKVFVRREEAV